MKKFNVCLLTCENAYICRVNESIADAMTEKGVHFVPWFARRNRRERIRTASGFNNERQTDCVGRREIGFGG